MGSTHPFLDGSSLLFMDYAVFELCMGCKDRKSKSWLHQGCVPCSHQAWRLGWLTMLTATEVAASPYLSQQRQLIFLWLFFQSWCLWNSLHLLSSCKNRETFTYLTLIYKAQLKYVIWNLLGIPPTCLPHPSSLPASNSHVFPSNLTIKLFFLLWRWRVLKQSLPSGTS